MVVNGKKLIEILDRIADVIEENKLMLTELDAAIGDGDHGINMSRGFHAVREKLKDDDGSDIGIILKKAGMALVSNVGGAAGPLYGTAFLKAGAVVEGKQTVDVADLENMLKSALEGIKMRGHAEPKDKTMVDAAEEALNALNSSNAAGESPQQAIKAAVDAAYLGLENTKDMIARKGRASYLAERSIGHKDAGAASFALILKTIFDELYGQESS
ncbi:dihydroxyacetone kinase subunit DhaL [Anaerobium acetethylicum]|uniref:phosphoenolpyruvate--glycerone phosphotransferase n=1 Tax=Anaerobium acetethylicum TaxID=1619234 RepID=A0A1D3TNN3_9FIRM|nr:dihydroxyacetone kinase subunit DhaL [Anaerobium acetethylicum]SCP94953.1 dihydroxyacetone kinase, C-terminal domain [Anaerobium acetethylicum]